LSGSSNFFGEVSKIWDFWGSTWAAHRLAVHQSSGGEKNCTGYTLFCIFIITIVIIITSISTISSINISFVALLNCLCLNPQVFPCVHFSSPSHWG